MHYTVAQEGMRVAKVVKLKADRHKMLMMLAWLVAFAAIGGLVALFITHAASVSPVVDSAIPKPANIKTFSEDRSIIVTWDRPSNAPSSLIGYYLTYKKKGSSTVEGNKQTIHEITQLQPLANGQEYEITIQSVTGSYLATPKGTLVNGDSQEPMYWARADGKVSPAVTVFGTTSSARVDSMRQRLTGFFDDFNEPTNPMDETKWNQAAFCGSAQDTKEFSSHAFINTQFHTHNSISCGFGGTNTRPRAIFDTTAATETNPAQVEFDMDISYDGRSQWYLDFIPLTARKDKHLMDLNGHFSPDPSADIEDPGNMLRFDVAGHGYGMEMHYWDTNRQFHLLDMHKRPTVCNTFGSPLETVDFRGGCDMTKKTLNQSPLPEPTAELLRTAQNVRRHWVMQFTPTKLKIFVDSALVGDMDLPAAWAAEKKYVLDNNMFSYNTGKGFTPSTDEFARHGVVPYFHFYHWDNFGFTGPSPTTLVHNYIEGGSDGKSPRYLNNNTFSQSGVESRTTTIPVPDDIGNPVGSRGKLYMTLKTGSNSYKWAPGDNIVFNGKRYDLPDFNANMVNPPAKYQIDGLEAGNVPVAINIDKADIKKGSNTLKFNLVGAFGPGLAINVHLELEYNKTDTAIPNYTQPIDIYGQTFSNIVEPNMSNCDAYAYVEQDMGLPTMSGTNLVPGPCVLLSAIPNHAGHGSGSPNPLPNPDITKPNITLTQPAANVSITGGTVAAAATATDDVGVTVVDFYVDNQLKSSDTSSPYQATLDFSAVANGTHSVYAIARDAAGNSTQTSAIIVNKQSSTTPPPTTKVGDINGDGAVNVFDLSIMLANYNTTVPVNQNGDLSGDGLVSITDLSILLSNYGT